MINSRSLNDLQPRVREMAYALQLHCIQQGIELLITSTYRDAESQAELYAQGRTRPGRRVTNAKPGQSYHNYRVAFDVVPIVGGKLQWNDMDLWNRIGEIGESVGLEWAGRWKQFREYPHFQYTGGKSLEQFAREWKTNNVGVA